MNPTLEARNPRDFSGAKQTPADFISLLYGFALAFPSWASAIFFVDAHVLRSVDMLTGMPRLTHEMYDRQPIREFPADYDGSGTAYCRSDGVIGLLSTGARDSTEISPCCVVMDLLIFRAVILVASGGRAYRKFLRARRGRLCSQCTMLGCFRFRSPLLFFGC